jgi:hypothetical protein
MTSAATMAAPGDDARGRIVSGSDYDWSAWWSRHPEAAARRPVQRDNIGLRSELAECRRVAEKARANDAGRARKQRAETLEWVGPAVEDPRDPRGLPAEGAPGDAWLDAVLDKRLCSAAGGFPWQRGTPGRGYADGADSVALRPSERTEGSIWADIARGLDRSGERYRTCRECGEERHAYLFVGRTCLPCQGYPATRERAA